MLGSRRRHLTQLRRYALGASTSASPKKSNGSVAEGEGDPEAAAGAFPARVAPARGGVVAGAVAGPGATAAPPIALDELDRALEGSSSSSPASPASLSWCSAPWRTNA